MNASFRAKTVEAKALLMLKEKDTLKLKNKTDLLQHGPYGHSFRAALGLVAVVASLALPISAVQAQNGSADSQNTSGTDFVVTRHIPVDTKLKVIVLTPVSSDSSQRGDLVKVKIAPDDTSGVPKSVVFVGHVRDAVAATRKRPGELAIRFDGLAPTGRWEPAGNGGGGPIEEASAHFVGSSSASGSSKDVGIGAAAGAVLGGVRKRKLGDAIEGGLLGALGGLAVQKATTHDASDVSLKNGQEVTITLNHPISLKTELIAS
jgi:hypothetical protein